MLRVTLRLMLALIALASVRLHAAPLSLEQALHLASSDSLGARGLGQRVLAAEAQVRTALGGLLPRLDANTSITRNNREVSLSDRVIVYQWDYNAQSSASVTLFEGASVPNWLAARRDEEGAVAAESWGKAELRAAAARAYFVALAARRNLDAAQRNVEVTAAAVRQTQARVDASFAVAGDLAQAELSHTQARDALVQTELALGDALDALSRIVNLPRVSAADLIEPSPNDLPSPKAPLDFDTRPDALALDHQRAAQELRTLGELLGLLPTLTLSANAFFGRANLRAPDGFFWTITLDATWTLFDYSRYGRIDASRAEEQRLALARDQLAQTTHFEQTRAERLSQAAQTRSELAQLALTQAREAQVGMHRRYEGGIATELDVAQADATAFRAEIAASLATLDVAVARLEVLRLAGGFLD
jgi:outer membrane protein TolC